MPNRFVVIDFETANADLSSICQVGIVVFEDQQVIERWGTLVNPEDYFDWINIKIHGINEQAVKNAPAFKEIYCQVMERLQGQVVVSHTSFDRTALSQAVTKYGLPVISCQWLDTASVVRRTWSQWARNGYRLPNVCRELGITYAAHDAIEDAWAAGEVLIQAIKTTGLEVVDWLHHVRQPVCPCSGIALTVNPDGVLVGEEMVFTGALTLPRTEAAARAREVLGCTVADRVKATTTILVVGDQDIRKLHGREKSSKHRKAEELIAKGQSIRILQEIDFLQLVQTNT